jgi:hypothetical protein
MRGVLLISCFLKFASGVAQGVDNDLSNTIWQLVGDDYVYQIYSNDKVYLVTDYTKSNYPDGGITLTIKRYGFYNSCIPPRLDSLQKNGIYYFELDSADFSDQESKEISIQNACGELNFVREGKTILMTIYYNSRQQYGTYRKVKEIPSNIQKYLKRKGIKVSQIK